MLVDILYMEHMGIATMEKQLRLKLSKIGTLLNFPELFWKSWKVNHQKTQREDSP